MTTPQREAPQDLKAAIIALARALERNDCLDETQWQMIDRLRSPRSPSGAAPTPPDHWPGLVFRAKQVAAEVADELAANKRLLDAAYAEIDRLRTPRSGSGIAPTPWLGRDGVYDPPLTAPRSGSGAAETRPDTPVRPLTPRQYAERCAEVVQHDVEDWSHYQRIVDGFESVILGAMEKGVIPASPPVAGSEERGGRDWRKVANELATMLHEPDFKAALDLLCVCDRADHSTGMPEVVCHVHELQALARADRGERAGEVAEGLADLLRDARSLLGKFRVYAPLDNAPQLAWSLIDQKLERAETDISAAALSPARPAGETPAGERGERAGEGWENDAHVASLLSDVVGGGQEGITYTLDGEQLRELLNYVAALSPARPAGETVGVIDAAYLAHQREWSERTFGPGSRAKGVVDHIRQELVEIEAEPTSTEWVDVIILALDGFWRAGYAPQQIIDAIRAKQAKNEARTWPDWRTMSADKAINHDRSVDSPTPSRVAPEGTE